MKFIKKGFVILLVVILLSFCTACAGMEGLADGLKDGVEQLDVNVTIGKSNALITPYDKLFIRLYFWHLPTGIYQS